MELRSNLATILLIILSTKCQNSLTFYRMQSVGVSGILYCGQWPLSGVEVALIDDDGE